MLMVLSPAKKQSLVADWHKMDVSSVTFPAQIAALVAHLQAMSSAEIQALMHVSPALADLNVARYQSFTPGEYHGDNACPAVLEPTNAPDAMMVRCLLAPTSLQVMVPAPIFTAVPMSASPQYAKCEAFDPSPKT